MPRKVLMRNPTGRVKGNNLLFNVAALETILPGRESQFVAITVDENGGLGLHPLGTHIDGRKIVGVNKMVTNVTRVGPPRISIGCAKKYVENLMRMLVLKDEAGGSVRLIKDR